MSKCKVCGKPTLNQTGVCVRTPECRSVYHKLYGRIRHGSLSNKCRVCGKPIRKDGEYCRRYECKKVYHREYYRNRYQTDEEFRKKHKARVKANYEKRMREKK